MNKNNKNNKKIKLIRKIKKRETNNIIINKKET